MYYTQWKHQKVKTEANLNYYLLVTKQKIFYQFYLQKKKKKITPQQKKTATGLETINAVCTHNFLQNHSFVSIAFIFSLDISYFKCCLTVNILQQ